MNCPVFIIKLLKTYGLLLSFIVCTAYADKNNDPMYWISQMINASETLDFKGELVGVRNSHIEALGIVRKFDNEVEHQRIFTLNGPQREIVRKADELVCYLPDKNQAVQAKLYTNKRYIPEIKTQDLNRLVENYTFDLLGSERVADRDAQIIRIKPKDEFRYGYKLWIDKLAGLVLQSVLLDNQDKELERYMFIKIDFNSPITHNDLAPNNKSNSNLAWKKVINTPKNVNDDDMLCEFKDLPNGFKLIHSINKPATKENKMMNHYVFNDGLATLSLFIERMADRDSDVLKGAYKLGAVNVYARFIDGNRITIVGEVPSATAKRVAMAVSPCH